jgi:hypothetical protein
MYWFHPLAWYVRRRLVLEAERAADDAVLATTDAADYADQLLRLARAASALPSAVLSMARSQDLAVRIRSVLDRHQTRGAATWRARSGVALVTAVAVAVLSPLAATAAGFDCIAFTSSAPGPILFGEDPHARVSEQEGGLCRPFGDISLADTCLSAAHMSVDELIVWAFGPDGIGPPWPPVIGGPAWLHSERFDITALATGREPGDAQRAAMVKDALVNRFGLAAHRELRGQSGFALMLDASAAHVNRLRRASTCTGCLDGFFRSPSTGARIPPRRARRHSETQPLPERLTISSASCSCRPLSTSP